MQGRTIQVYKTRNKIKPISMHISLAEPGNISRIFLLQTARGMISNRAVLSQAQWRDRIKPILRHISLAELSNISSIFLLPTKLSLPVKPW